VAFVFGWEPRGTESHCAPLEAAFREGLALFYSIPI
jgi:hypothetical protein